MTSLKIGASNTGVKMMSKALNILRRLFEPKANSNDMVRYIRTEFGKETEHLADEDCLEYYNYYLTRRR